MEQRVLHADVCRCLCLTGKSVAPGQAALRERLRVTPSPRAPAASGTLGLGRVLTSLNVAARDPSSSWFKQRAAAEAARLLLALQAMQRGKVQAPLGVPALSPAGQGACPWRVVRRAARLSHPPANPLQCMQQPGWRSLPAGSGAHRPELSVLQRWSSAFRIVAAIEGLSDTNTQRVFPSCSPSLSDPLFIITGCFPPALLTFGTW